MSSAAAEIGAHDRLIREVFIEPIRTVIVVDDEYPTLDSLAAKEVGDGDGWKKGNTQEVQAVRQLLEFARKRAKPWLIDVHDAKKNPSSEMEQGIASHLDHSDLLVLDYHLDGNDGSGDAAIGILRKLARSDHFNLVIVHTKGYKGDFDKVVREIALGLTYSDLALSFTEEERQSLITALDKWEEQEEGITTKLEAEISENTYLQLRTECPNNPDGILGLAEGKSILELWKARPQGVKIEPKQLARWLVLKKQEQMAKQFSSENLGGVQVGRSADINWIRTDKLFITVLSKECTPDQFETKLTDAIKTSFPSPHRLLLTRMRAEIDQHGLVAETAILRNRHMQAEWLNDFLKADPVDARAVIHNTVSRHWEALGDELGRTLGDFAEELRNCFSPMGISEVMTRCGLKTADVGTDESLKYFNCFSSTKPIDRSHLTTGHIFEANGIEGGESSFWICLSPACDMVPGQKNHPGLSDCIPFVAVRLHKVSDGNALNHATDNIFLFLDIGGKVETFSIYKDGNVTTNPVWEQKFARNKGRFGAENGLMLGSILEKDGGVTAIWADAAVVAQLRSEYALNLLQRMGALLSRPGLGMNFKGRSEKR